MIRELLPALRRVFDVVLAQIDDLRPLSASLRQQFNE
jgi:hypothetical protein